MTKKNHYIQHASRYLLAVCAQPFTAVSAILIYAVLLIGSVYQHWNHPAANWDALPYTALALQLDGVGVNELRTSALAEVRAAFPDQYSGFVSGSDYVQTVTTDDAAFIAQLPFYKVKPLYVAGVYLLGKLQGNFAIATAHLSTLAFMLIGILAAIARPRRVPIAIWLLGLILISSFVGPVPLSLLAAASTPDTLSGALFLAGILLARDEKIGAAAVLLLLAQLARPDAVVAVLPFLTLFAFMPQRRLPLLLVAGLAIGIQQAVARLAGNYPLEVLLSTLISPQPFPGGMTLALGSPEYIRILIHYLGELAANPRFLLLGLIGIFTLILSLKKRAGWSIVLLLTALINIIAHILLFPEAGGYQERFLFTSYLLILMTIGFDGKKLSQQRMAPP